MLASRRDRGGRSGLAVVALVLVLAVWLAHAAGAAEPPAGDASYGGPSADAVRVEVQAILADPRFAPQVSFWQWLAEKLSQTDLPDLSVPPGVSRFLVWVFLIWCVLTLVAILVHMAWSLTRFLPARRRRQPPPRYERRRPLTYEELRERMAALAEAREFRSAIRAMMTALVQWLDDVGVVRGDPSKTNGDYVREYPAGRPGREMFRQFALAFDVLIYGSPGCDGSDYRRMCTALEQIHEHVSHG